MTVSIIHQSRKQSITFLNFKRENGFRTFFWKKLSFPGYLTSKSSMSIRVLIILRSTAF